MTLGKCGLLRKMFRKRERAREGVEKEINAIPMKGPIDFVGVNKTRENEPTCRKSRILVGQGKKSALLRKNPREEFIGTCSKFYRRFLNGLEYE